MEKLEEYLEIYKCAVLTVIALLVAGIWINTPVPVTPANLRSKRVAMEQMPLVRVHDGSIEVDNTVQVEVSNTVEVEGTVSIER